MCGHNKHSPQAEGEREKAATATQECGCMLKEPSTRTGKSNIRIVMAWFNYFIFFSLKTSCNASIPVLTLGVCFSVPAFNLWLCPQRFAEIINAVDFDDIILIKQSIEISAVRSSASFSSLLYETPWTNTQSSRSMRRFSLLFFCSCELSCSCQLCLCCSVVIHVESVTSANFNLSGTFISSSYSCILQF